MLEILMGGVLLQFFLHAVFCLWTVHAVRGCSQADSVSQLQHQLTAQAKLIAQAEVRIQDLTEIVRQRVQGIKAIEQHQEATAVLERSAMALEILREQSR